MGNCRLRFTSLISARNFVFCAFDHDMSRNVLINFELPISTKMHNFTNSTSLRHFTLTKYRLNVYGESINSKKDQCSTNQQLCRSNKFRPVLDPHSLNMTLLRPLPALFKTINQLVSMIKCICRQNTKNRCYRNRER